MMQTVLKKELVIDSSRSFLLSDLPFKTGEKVVVFVISESDLTAKLKKWQTLLKETQALSQVKDITDADIDAEIEAYRASLMQQPVRNVYAHRSVVDNIELPARENLYKRE
jgi:predicted DNA-binding antitoxin AbrB/MazE fold protein